MFFGKNKQEKKEAEPKNHSSQNPSQEKKGTNPIPTDEQILEERLRSLGYL